MNLQDEKKIREWHDSIEKPIEIQFLQTRTPQDDPFARFCRILADCAPYVSIRTVTDDSTVKAVEPEIRINPQIRYTAIPEGPELEPFLSALKGCRLSPEAIPEVMQPLQDRIPVPVELKLYITPSCPFCPSVVRQMVLLTQTDALIRLSVIDGMLFPQLAEADKIQSVPSLLFDPFRWTGKVPIEEVVKAIVDRDPASISSETLGDIIQDGAADEVARMMLESGMIFPSFLPLLCHEKWPKRLGAMVVMETIIEADLNLACQAVGPLCDVVASLDDPVKGDILYILGEIGAPDALPVIGDIQKRTNNEDVRSAATEAIERINKVGYL